MAADGGGEGAAPKVGQAEVASLAVLKQPVRRFNRLVDRLSRQIEAEERAAAERRQRERREEFEALPGGVSMATLEAIASCESGGDPTIVSADGTYRGKYQFDFGTWESVGGSGDPAAAPEYEQDYRAALLYARAGSSPWPVCG
ncbi:MAG TPA: transglycosylase family protein [Solirubrobacterales bacterium]|nr:transglycosylase family protein [Solirubrobacterales bacterium]